MLSYGGIKADQLVGHHGKDGIYVGKYDGMAGKWCFQHKFHADEKAVSQVKNDMEKEVPNIEDED